MEEIGSRTLLVVTESGFESIRGKRRLEAWRMNERGWALQMKDIEGYVAETSS